MWSAPAAGIGVRDGETKVLFDPRSPEEVLADELPASNGPEATEKTAIRSAYQPSGLVLYTVPCESIRPP